MTDQNATTLRYEVGDLRWLAPLTGSEKQVAWASGIRRSWYQEFTTMVRNFIAAGKTVKGLDEVMDALAAQTSAAWWIDHRNYAEALHIGHNLLRHSKQAGN